MLKILPFIVSIVWEALSPVVSYSIRKLLRKYLQDINCIEDRDTCMVLLTYARDSLQMISGLLMTLAAFSVITFLEMNQDYWIILFFILIILFIVQIINVLTSNPYKWDAKRYLFWSKKTTYAIILNIVLIALVVYLPEIKGAIPPIFK